MGQAGSKLVLVGATALALYNSRHFLRGAFKQLTSSRNRDTLQQAGGDEVNEEVAAVPNNNMEEQNDQGVQHEPQPDQVDQNEEPQLPAADPAPAEEDVQATAAEDSQFHEAATEHEPFGIFLASSNAANDMQLLKRKNVSLVFSCQNYPVTEPYKKSVPSIILNLDGCQEEDILLSLRHLFFDSLQCAWKSGGNVLVVYDNTSLVFVMALLITVFGHTYDQALSVVGKPSEGLTDTVKHKIKQWASSLGNGNIHRRFVMRQWGGGWIPAWDEAAEREDSSVILEHSGSAQIIWPGQGNGEAVRAAEKWAATFSHHEFKERAVVLDRVRETEPWADTPAGCQRVRRQA